VDPFTTMSLTELQKQQAVNVYYEFDSSMLDDKARGTLQQAAQFLTKRPSVRVRLEGHADERGTSEYNLALGERRANTARDYLVSLGVPGDRLQVLSRGEEQPVCTESNEGCWSQNRRAGFIYTAK
jgi:peptidoglycan-associated lipoprotein